MSANYLQLAMYKEWSSLVIESDSRQIHMVVYVFSSSAKLCINIPKFYWRFKYNILHVARSYFSGSLVFNLQKMSVVLNLDNSVSRSPFEIPLAWLFVLKIDSVAYVEGWWFPVHGLLCSLEVIFI